MCIACAFSFQFADKVNAVGVPVSYPFDEEKKNDEVKFQAGN